MAQAAARLLRGTREIAEYLACSPRTVAFWRDRYGLPIAKVGKLLTTSTTLIDAWLLVQSEHQRAERIQRLLARRRPAKRQRRI